MYSVSIIKRAEKDIKRLDRSTKNRVVKAVMSLADEPRPAGCRKILSEEGVWRIRVGIGESVIQLTTNCLKLQLSASQIVVNLTINNNFLLKQS